jgi:hypothetical protein
MTIDSVVPNPLDRIRLIGLVLVGGSHSPLNVSDTGCRACGALLGVAPASPDIENTTIDALEAVYQLPNAAILGSSPQHA